MNEEKGIYAVTVARYATMYVEAFTSNEAMRIAEKYKDDVDDFDFGMDIEVDSCENYTTDLEDVDTEHIYTEEGRVSVSSYEERMRNKLSNSETCLVFAKDNIGAGCSTCSNELDILGSTLIVGLLDNVILVSFSKLTSSSYKLSYS